MGKSNIGYLKYVWNTYTNNCTKVSQGCKFCYAEAMTDRYGGAGTFAGTPQLRTTAEKLLKDIPAGQIVGVNFLSDTWHEGVPLETIAWVHEQIQRRDDCIFVYTTKRANRLAVESHKVPMPYNLWVGVSVEDASQVKRITALRHSAAKHRWISFEPLLEEIAPKVGMFQNIEWVITGAESGTNRRYFDLEWATTLGHAAQLSGAVWYHKQGSHFYPGQNALIDGQLVQELPKAFTALKTAPPVETQPRLL